MKMCWKKIFIPRWVNYESWWLANIILFSMLKWVKNLAIEFCTLRSKITLLFFVWVVGHYHKEQLREAVAKSRPTAGNALHQGALYHKKWLCEAGAKGRPTAGNALRQVPYPPCKDVLKFVKKTPRYASKKPNIPLWKSEIPSYNKMPCHFSKVKFQCRTCRPNTLKQFQWVFKSSLNNQRLKSTKSWK